MMNASRKTSRTGVSLFQMLGCLMAIAGGAWLGAWYMNVEVEDIAYTALDETEMLESLPEDWRPVRSDCPDGVCPPELTSDEESEALQQEFVGLQSEVARLREAAATGQTTPPYYSEAQTAEQETLRRERTIGYWNRLREISNSLTQLDQEVEPAINPSTTGHVFDLRRRSFDYARRAIQAIPNAQVDRQAVEAGQRLADWYGRGAEFYEQATAVWDGLAGGEQGKSAEQDLEKSKQQRAKEAKLVRAKLAELNSLLSRRYDVAFPGIDL